MHRIASLAERLTPSGLLRWLVFRRSGRFAVSIGVGYLLGTFSTADVVAKRVAGDVDLRTVGTGNPGAANAIQVLGTKAGLAVMAGDIAKGVLACGVGGALAGPAAAHLAGTASVAGHCYPVWNGFKGGKGVATSVGQCLATFPIYFPIDVGVAAATAAVPAFKQRAFAATLASSVCWVAGGVVWWIKGGRNLWGPKPSIMLPVSALLSSSMIAQRFVAAGDPSARRLVDAATDVMTSS
jgi:acyl phosphate:glycerol-3-phosphate acyltransferase